MQQASVRKKVTKKITREISRKGNKFGAGSPSAAAVFSNSIFLNS